MAAAPRFGSAAPCFGSVESRFGSVAPGFGSVAPCLGSKGVVTALGCFRCGAFVNRLGIDILRHRLQFAHKYKKLVAKKRFIS